MTREDIIRMAREAGLYWTDGVADPWTATDDELESFARAVAAAERAACIKVCDGIRYKGYVPPEDGAAAEYYDNAADDCANAIARRGQV